MVASLVLGQSYHMIIPVLDMMDHYQTTFIGMYRICLWEFIMCLLTWINFNGCTVEVWEWINNLIPHFIMDVITYPCWDSIQTILVKGAPKMYCNHTDNEFLLNCCMCWNMISSFSRTFLHNQMIKLRQPIICVVSFRDRSLLYIQWNHTFLSQTNSCLLASIE